MFKFTQIGEQRYYSNKSNNIENIYLVDGFRLSFYISAGFIYCYYIGQYYFADVRVYTRLDENDILDSIKKECSDPSRVEINEID